MIILSICIPFYNRYDTLAENLKLILMSKSKEFEVVIVDNCSVEDIEQHIMITDSRIRIVKRNKAVSGPKNLITCLKYAKGKYALLCLDKNYIWGENLEDFINCLKRHAEICGGICSFYNTLMHAKEKSKQKISPYKFYPMSKVAYLSRHPTGYFYLSSIVQSSSIYGSETFTENAFGVDCLLAECAAKGAMIKWNAPLVFGSCGLTGESIKSYTYSAKNQNLYFFPGNGIKQFFLYCRHLNSLEVSRYLYLKTLLHLYRLTLCHITIDYRDFITNPSACYHYHIEPRQVTRKQLISFVKRFNYLFLHSEIIKNKMLKYIVVVIVNIGFFSSKWKKF